MCTIFHCRPGVNFTRVAPVWALNLVSIWSLRSLKNVFSDRSDFDRRLVSIWSPRSLRNMKITEKASGSDNTLLWRHVQKWRLWTNGLCWRRLFPRSRTHTTEKAKGRKGRRAQTKILGQKYLSEERGVWSVQWSCWRASSCRISSPNTAYCGIHSMAAIAVISGEWFPFDRHDRRDRKFSISAIAIATIAVSIWSLRSLNTFLSDRGDHSDHMETRLYELPTQLRREIKVWFGWRRTVVRPFSGSHDAGRTSRPITPDVEWTTDVMVVKAERTPNFYATGPWAADYPPWCFDQLVSVDRECVCFPNRLLIFLLQRILRRSRRTMSSRLVRAAAFPLWGTFVCGIEL